MECKVYGKNSSNITQLLDLIETLWNVKLKRADVNMLENVDLIETLWNVKNFRS